MPWPFLAEALKVNVFPSSTLALGPGANASNAGMGLVITFVGVPLLHERRKAQAASKHTRDVAGTNLRMNPSAKKLVLLGKLSV